MPTNDTKTEEAGPRSFSVLLQKIGDGDCHTDLGKEMHDLVKTIQARAKESSSAQKGKLVLTLSLAGDDAGTLDITYDIKKTVPKPKRGPRSTFWIDKAGHVVDANPKQTTLGLRDVSKERAQENAREAGSGERPAREA